MARTSHANRLMGWLGFALGLGAVVGLVAWQGFDAIAAAFVEAGVGLVLLILLFIPHLALSGGSWRALFPPGGEPSLKEAMRGMWIGSSVNTLLPTATIGGEVVKVRLLTLLGHSGATAGASVVADKTVQAITVVLWALVGIGLLLWMTAGGDVILGAVVGAVLFGLAVAGFVLVQHAGAFAFLARVVGVVAGRERAARLHEKAAHLDDAIRQTYRRPQRLVWSCTLRLLARVVLALEVWLAAWLMGYPITLAEAVMLRSIGVALRSVAFVVPNGLGVQEGAFLVLSGLVGLAPEGMLAVSLATRAREYIVAAPGLPVWHQIERRAFHRGRAAKEAAE